MKGKDSKEIWKSLGYNKTFDTPEEFFLDIIDGIKIKEQDKYPKSVFLVKNNVVLFEQDFENDYLWVGYDKIWCVFEIIFGLNYQELIMLIKGLVEEHLNWNGLTPQVYHRYFQQQVEEHSNYKCFTIHKNVVKGNKLLPFYFVINK